VSDAARRVHRRSAKIRKKQALIEAVNIVSSDHGRIGPSFRQSSGVFGEKKQAQAHQTGFARFFMITLKIFVPVSRP
jgi:hypothetical protein